MFRNALAALSARTRQIRACFATPCDLAWAVPISGILILGVLFAGLNVAR